MSSDPSSTSRARRPADQPGQARHGPAAGDQADAHFPLRQDRLFPAGETHVAGQSELAAVPCRPTADQGDRHEGRARQAHKDVRPRLQPRGPLRYAGQILELGEEIAVVQEEPFDGAVEDHDLDLLVGLEGRHDLPKFQNEFRTHQIQRRIVERDPPIGGRRPGKPDLRRLRCRAHKGLLGQRR